MVPLYILKSKRVGFMKSVRDFLQSIWDLLTDRFFWYAVVLIFVVIPVSCSIADENKNKDFEMYNSP